MSLLNSVNSPNPTASTPAGPNTLLKGPIEVVNVFCNIVELAFADACNTDALAFAAAADALAICGPIVFPRLCPSPLTSSPLRGLIALTLPRAFCVNAPAFGVLTNLLVLESISLPAEFSLVPLSFLPSPLNIPVKPFVALPKGPPKDIAPRLNDANPAEAVNATIATLAAFISPVRGFKLCITRSADVAKSL